MENNDSAKPDVSRIRHMLKETARLAEHASLTGSLSKGSRTAVRQYNSILEYLERTESVPKGFFVPLDEDAGFDEVGVVSAQLAGYLTEDDDSRERRRGERGGGCGPTVAIGAFGVREIEELKDLGRVIRESLPEWARWKTGGIPPTPPVPPVPPTPPTPPTPAAGSTTYSHVWTSSSTEDRQSDLDAITAELQAVAARLRSGDLTAEEQAAIVDEMVALARRQSELAGERR